MDGELYDKTGTPIKVGDVLKVFHFVGARRKRHYMYKHVLSAVHLGKENPKPYLKISHLSLDESEYYHERLDGRFLQDYEIVQGCEAYWKDRKRASPQSIEEPNKGDTDSQHGDKTNDT